MGTMRITIVVVLVLLAALSSLFAQNAAQVKPPPTPKMAVNAVLDDFHDAAAKADGNHYFEHMLPDSVFLGTDATERWTKEQFQAYAKPHFDAGRGWTYNPGDRHVSFSPTADVAWFDESLTNAKYGECRGSGVLLKTDRGWKISQYNLTVPVPNELLEKVAGMIREK